MKWNFGVCTGHKNFEKLEIIANAGYDYFEFNFSDIGNDDESHVKETVDLVKELKMYVPSMNMLLGKEYVITGKNADTQRAKEFVEKTFERVLPFGTKNFVFGSGKSRTYSEDFPEERVRE